MRKRSAQKYGKPLSLDALRASEDGGAVALDPAGNQPRADELVSAEEEKELLLGELDRLHPDQKEVIVLREFQGLAYEEIAEIVGVPVGTVRSRLFRARADLRDRLRGKIL